MKKYIFLLLLISQAVIAQPILYINPGIKIGVSYHNEIEFSFGYELSFLIGDMNNNENKYGLVLDYDTVNDIKRLHIGFEYMYRFVGVDVGPTFGWKGNEKIYGFSVIPFGGLLLLAYYNYTYFYKETDIHELGSYIKIAIPTRDLNFKIQ